MIHRHTLLASALGLAVALLAACGGGGDAQALAPIAQAVPAEASAARTHEASDTVLPVPDTLGGRSSVMAASAERLLLQANGDDSSISVFGLDAVSGVPTLKKNTKTPGLRPNSLAVANKVVYASFLGGSLRLAAYRLADDGSLAPLGLYRAAQAAPTRIVVSPDQRFVLVSSGTASTAVLSFPINADGTLGNPVANPQALPRI